MSATALRGPAGAPIEPASPPRPPAAVRARPPAGGADPPPPAVAAAVRVAAAAALALFGAASWAGMVEPRDAGPLLGAAGTGAGLAVAAAATAPLSRSRRAAVLAVLALIGAAAALRLAGVPARLLDTDRWDELAGAIGRGLDALPATRVPYGGVDEWTRTVLLLGGTLLAVAGPLLAGARRRPRAPVGAATVLAVLYAMPAVQLGSDSPWLAGALFGVLLAALLFGHRLRPRDLPLAAAAVVAASLAGVAVAPRLDGDRPWVDYEAVARSLGEGGTQRFAWGHSYGPLRWPRENREVLRVRARHPAYWKATTLIDFDGVRWRELMAPELGDDRDVARANPRWVQRVRFTVRDLTSRQFIGAGTTLAIERSSRRPVEGAPGSFVAAGRPLRRGHAYAATVYTPRPARAQLARAGTAYGAELWPYLTMRLPRAAGGPMPVDPVTERPDAGADPAVVVFGPFGHAQQVRGFRGRDYADPDGERWVRDSRYDRTYALARRLARDARTPYAFARRVQRHLRRGFLYTETPRAGRLPLDTFLFETQAGYCQHFAGAMALLLRMGGVPARVAGGFTPGVRDEAGRERVVTDLDAHSWVEAWFPGIGWMTFDPTPPEAPARAQQAPDRTPAASGDDSTPRDSSERAGDPGSPDAGAAAAGGDGGPPWGALAAGLAALAGAGAFAVRRRRRSRAQATPAEDPWLAELERALRRSGRPPRPGMTLGGVERELQHWPDAAAYVRAVRAGRYGYGPAAPTPRQRRALRHALAAGAGPGGRMRGWWAVPPRAPRG